jgi:putative two-component system response regulator
MTSKILIIDDEIIILDVMTNALKEFGWDVTATSRPAEALRLVKHEKFHMVYVDNYLGPVEGIELIEKMGKINPDLQFVIMTGNPNIDIAIHALKTGVADFLRKPFRIEELLVSVDHVNRRLELEHQRKDLLAGLELKIQEKTAELKQTYLSVLITLSRTVENKDLGTYGHSMRVCDLSTKVAEKLGLPTTEIEVVRAAAQLHDIGKIGISDSILAKQGPLTEDECGIIRSHPQKGVEILQPLKQFEALLPAILHHHEHFDGSGYPAGLSGDAIPLSARIIAVADAYDAILSDRPYRMAAPHDNAMSELCTWSGKQFDARVLSAFEQIMHVEQGNAVFARGA